MGKSKSMTWKVKDLMSEEKKEKKVSVSFEKTTMPSVHLGKGKRTLPTSTVDSAIKDFMDKEANRKILEAQMHEIDEAIAMNRTRSLEAQARALEAEKKIKITQMDIEKVDADIRAKQEAEAEGQEVQETTGRKKPSVLANPEVLKILGDMEDDKREKLMQTLLIADINPTLASTMYLINAFNKAPAQEIKAYDPLDTVAKVFELVKSAQSLVPPPAPQVVSAPSDKPNPLEGVVTKVVTNFLEDAMMERLGLKPPATSPMVETPEGVREMHWNEEAQMYLPKVLTYDQYLEVEDKRYQRQKEIQKDIEDKKTRDTVMKTVTKAIDKAGPLITKFADSIGNKMAEAGAVAGSTVKPATPPTPVTEQRSIKCTNVIDEAGTVCGNEIVFEVPPKNPYVVCSKCGAKYELREEPPG